MLNIHVHFSITLSFIPVCHTLIVLFGLYSRYLSSLFVFCYSTILTLHFHFVCSLGNDFQNALLFVLLSHRDFTHNFELEMYPRTTLNTCKCWDDSHVTPWLHSIQILSFIFPIQLDHWPWNWRIQCVFSRRNWIPDFVVSATIVWCVFCHESIFCYFKVKGRLVPFALRLFVNLFLIVQCP
jgi:hypothetical protein